MATSLIAFASIQQRSGTQDPVKKAENPKTANVAQEALKESSKKWTRRSKKIKDWAINCFTWGPAVPAIAAFLIGLVISVVFPYFTVGAVAGTVAAFVLAALAWGGTYLVGALLMLLAKACEPKAT